MLNEDVIKRIVLFEKQLGFAFHKCPHDVPDKFWREIFLSKEFAYNFDTHENACQYIASKILSPLLGIKTSEFESFVISPTMYDPMTFIPFRRIIFERLCTFNVNSELIWELGSYWAHSNVLKDLVCIIWDKRVTQPVFVFDRTPQVDFTLVLP